MPIKKWIKQAMLLFPVVCALLGLVQYLKGRDANYSIRFGLFWGTITLIIFFGTRIYYFKKGMYCKVCDDLMSPNESNNGNKN